MVEAQADYLIARSDSANITLFLDVPALEAVT